MKRPRPRLTPGIRTLSPKIAGVCGIAAIATVLVAVVVGPRWRTGVEPSGLTRLETNDNTQYDLYIVASDGAMTVHEKRDGSDARPYSVEEIGLRLRQAKNRHATITRALLVVEDGTSVQELQTRMTELNQLGIGSIAVAAEVPGAGP